MQKQRPRSEIQLMRLPEAFRRRNRRGGPHLSGWPEGLRYTSGPNSPQHTRPNDPPRPMIWSMSSTHGSS